LHTSSVPIRSRNRPQKRLLVHLSQAVETLALAKAPRTHVIPLKGSLNGSLKLQSFDVSSHEFDHVENISEALHRLEKGTYGRCIFCGASIETDLLAQAPWAAECRECGDQESQP
jgi:hypothetical protein